MEPSIQETERRKLVKAAVEWASMDVKGIIHKNANKMDIPASTSA